MSTVVVSIDEVVGIGRPIDFVRLLREHGGFGLKEGKELLDKLVEAHSIRIIFDEGGRARHFIEGCQSLGLSAQLVSPEA